MASYEPQRATAQNRRLGLVVIASHEAPGAPRRLEVPEAKNSPAAFERAFAAGYGVELNMRDDRGALVISHDPPTGAKCCSRRCSPCTLASRPPPLAINIKSDSRAFQDFRRCWPSSWRMASCATYGAPVHVPMDEAHPQAPLNPYGDSKLMVERILRDLDRYSGFRSAILRYFNAAGADPQGRIGEKHDPETHAIPLAIRAALGLGGGFKLFGTDYETRDGTAVRDYIHVLDLADAHVRALKRLLDGGTTEAFNLGTGRGVTVRELTAAIAQACGGFNVEEGPRREGDAPTLVADAGKAEAMLGWVPTRGLYEIVDSAAAWHRREAPAR